MNMTVTSPSKSVRAISHLLLAFCFCALLSCSNSEAAVVGYWRFGDDPNGFLADSGPNGLNLTDPESVTQEAIPATGRGAAFDTVTGNAFLADFPTSAAGGVSAPKTADAPAFTLTNFTIEALININRDDNVPIGTLSRLWTIAGQYDLSTQRSWSLSVVQDQNQSAQLQAGNLYMNISTNGIAVQSISSGFHILKDKDYHVAAAYDSSAGMITFYAQNLTDGTLELATVTHGLGVVHNSTANFTIGALTDTAATLNPSLGFRGKIDEVRLSNTLLSESQLLVPPLAQAPGDADRNGTVNINDYLLIQAHSFTTVPVRQNGDVTDDGFVDFSDFQFWKANFPGGVAAAEAAIAGLGVPEPTASMLSGVGIVLILSWCGHKAKR